MVLDSSVFRHLTQPVQLIWATLCSLLDEVEVGSLLNITPYRLLYAIRRVVLRCGDLQYTPAGKRTSTLRGSFRKLVNADSSKLISRAAGLRLSVTGMVRHVLNNRNLHFPELGRSAGMETRSHIRLRLRRSKDVLRDKGQLFAHKPWCRGWVGFLRFESAVVHFSCNSPLLPDLA